MVNVDFRKKGAEVKTEGKMRKPAYFAQAKKLELYDVVNPEGRDLGQVQDFMLDMEHGRVALVIVSFGGTLGLSDKWFALPYDRLKWSPADRKFVMNMPREVLEKAPGLDKDKWPEELDFTWLRRCYDYYGCTAYWMEGSHDEHIKKLAYDIWEKEDRPEGKDVEHYYRAEKIMEKDLDS